MKKVLGAAVAAGAGVLAWSLIEAQSFVVRQVSAPALAPGSRPIRILHVSDLHLTPSQGRKVEWVRHLASFRPDLVVNTGDNLAHVDAVPTALEALEPLFAFPGVFVHGSNDYYAPTPRNPLKYLKEPTQARDGKTSLDTAALTAGLEARGWTNLNNARATAAIAGTEVAFVGMDDPHIGRDRLPEPADISDAALRIGVVHAPYLRALGQLREDGADLILAGHTHGGQVCVPGKGALVTNCDLDTERASGLHGWPGPRPDEQGGSESAWLHVSGGLGTSPYTPVRLACRPSVTMLTLLPR